MKYIWLAFILFLSFTINACEKKVDGSSEEAMKKSIQEITEGLPESKKESFKKATVTVMMSDLSLGSIVSGLQDEETIIKEAMKKLKGKTADEVIAMAKQIEVEREAKKRAEQIKQAKEEIEKLTVKKAESEKARSQLKKFRVISSRFKKETQRFGRPQPIINLSVINETSQTISQAYFKGTYITPGRSVPWLEEEFSYEISGGLEPGEKAEWNLAPNMFGEWGQLEAIDDAVLTTEVTRLDGPDGNPLWEDDFKKDDEKRLKALLFQLKELDS